MLKNYFKIKYIWAYFSLLCVFPTHLYALSHEEKGLQIIEEIDRRDTGFGDLKSSMKMILRNRAGEESIRSLTIKTLEVIGDGDKNLSVFSHPRDIKGTAFLSYTHALESDEQWLYLPALKRVKRISSTNKSGPYLGSEFAFEDLTSFEVKKFTYKYLRDETYNDKDCFVIELIPLYKFSGYTKQVIWVDKTRYIVLKTDYFDRKNSLLKTLEYKKYQLYLDRYWRAGEMLMSNHQNGKTTVLLWESYQFRNGFTARNFDRNTLKRSR